MDLIIQWLETRDYWDWFILGLVLLMCELFGAGLYLFWIGIAAILVGVLQFIFPTMSWQMQLITFSALSLAMGWVWWIIQHRTKKDTDQPNLNQRAEGFIGRTYSLKEAIVDGYGYVNIDDSLWRVMGEDMPEKTRVRVVGHQDMVLKVEKVDGSEKPRS